MRNTSITKAPCGAGCKADQLLAGSPIRALILASVLGRRFFLSTAIRNSWVVGNWELNSDFARHSPIIEHVRSCARENLSRFPALSLVSRDPAAYEQFQLLPSSLKAEKLQPQALDAQRRGLGPEHPDTLSTMSDLFATLAMGGHLEEAEKLGREVLEKQRRVLGVEDHHTIATMDNLAATLGQEGRFGESEQMEAETIELERRVYGPDHLGVLMSMGNQADNLYSLGKYGEAKQLLQQTLDIQLRVLSQAHPETARSTYNLGCLAARDGKRDEAFSLLTRAVDRLSPVMLLNISGDPALDALHVDRRFAALVARGKRHGAGGAKCPL